MSAIGSDSDVRHDKLQLNKLLPILEKIHFYYIYY